MNEQEDTDWGCGYYRALDDVLEECERHVRIYHQFGLKAQTDAIMHIARIISEMKGR